MSTATVASACCDQWETGAVTDHVENALSPDERRRWDDHSRLRALHKVLNEMQAVIRLLGTLPRLAPEVLHAVRKAPLLRQLLQV